jgi:hypothetical protein
MLGVVRPIKNDGVDRDYLLEIIDKQKTAIASLPTVVSSAVTKALADKPTLLYSNKQETLISIPGLNLSFPADQMNHALSFLNPMFDRGLIYFLAHNLLPGTVYIDVGVASLKWRVFGFNYS